MRLLGIKSMAALSKKAGLNETAIKAIMSGKSKHPREDTLGKIARALGCGVADLTDPDIRGHEESIEEDTQPVAATNLARVIHVSEINVELGASPDGTVHPDESTYGRHEREVARWAMPLDVIRSHTPSPQDQLRIVRVRGDSMKPDFQPGDRVLVDLADRMPSPPGVFAVWDGFAQVIKRLEMIPYSDPPKVMLLSANPAYGPRELLLRDVIINGRVVGRWDRV